MSSSVLRNVIHPSQPLGSVGLGTSEAPDGTEKPPTTMEMELVLGVLVENAPVAMAMFDHQMRYMLANRQWIAEFGLQQMVPLTGKSQYEVFPGLHSGWRQVYDRALQGHVVRSEHDALAGPDGRRIIYQWEVRPWRRKRDASVGGVMVTCERFTTQVPNPSEIQRDEDEEVLASSPSAKTEPTLDFFQAELPMVILDEQGKLLRASVTAANLCLARGIQEGVSSFWDSFGDGRDASTLKSKVLEVIAALSGNGNPAAKFVDLKTQPQETQASAFSTTRWLFARLRPDENGRRFSAVALPEVPLEERPPSPERMISQSLPSLAQVVASVASKPAADTSSSMEMRRLQDDLARTRQELRTLQEASQSFSRRESRQRLIVDALPCGILVLDEHGAPIFQNDQLTRLLGRPVQKDETVEQWLASACPDELHRDDVTSTWRESVWRRQLTKTISLATTDGLLKELEFKPVSLPGGGLLVSIQDATELCRHEEQLRALEAKFRVLFQQSPVASVLMDKAGAIYEVNHQAEQLLGHSKAELRRYPLDAWLEPESASARREAIRKMREEGQRDISVRVRIRQSSVESVPAELHIADVADSEGEPHCTIHFFEKLETIPPLPTIAAIPQPHPVAIPQPFSSPGKARTQVLLLKTNVNGRISAWSPGATALFGCAEEMAKGIPLHSFFKPSDPSGFFAELTAQSKTPETTFVLRYFPKSGGSSSHGFIVRHRGQGTMDFELWDGEATSQMEPAAAQPMALSAGITPAQRWPIADLDREKLLLSETHHRIKNHLQIISSLLNLELNTVNEQNARVALRSSQNRVRSIAALHQHLYQIAQGSSESFGDFAKGLLEHLRTCYDVPESRVQVRLEIQEGAIQQEWLMPLALTLNETLSNSFEHGFPGDQAGEVIVRLHLEAGSGEFVIEDNGIGLPKGFVPQDSLGLGLKILAVFAEQMRGQLLVLQNNPQGAEIRLRFPIASADI